MKKVRINTSLRHKLESYVRGQIEAGMDKTPLESARRRLEAEALRLIQSAYPPEDMQLLASYGKADRYARFTFLLPDGEAESFEFPHALACDLPACGGYRFEHPIPADAGFAAAAQEVASIDAALREEARRQWKQAEVLVNCALYFEDVLEYLGIPHAERVTLSHRWQVPVHAAVPEPDPSDDAGTDGEEGESGGEAETGLMLVKPAPKLLEACLWLKQELCEAWDQPEETAIPQPYLVAIAEAEAA